MKEQFFIERVLGFNAGYIRASEYSELKFYNCIFDEERGKYDKNNPHKHIVLEAYRIDAPGYIYDGIAFIGEKGIIKRGCELRYFDTN